MAECVVSVWNRLRGQFQNVPRSLCWRLPHSVIASHQQHVVSFWILFSTNLLSLCACDSLFSTNLLSLWRLALYYGCVALGCLRAVFTIPVFHTALVYVGSCISWFCKYARQVLMLCGAGTHVVSNVVMVSAVGLLDVVGMHD